MLIWKAIKPKNRIDTETFNAKLTRFAWATKIRKTAPPPQPDPPGRIRTQRPVQSHLLSQIENETSAPPIPTLIRIAKSPGSPRSAIFSAKNQVISGFPSCAEARFRRETEKLPHNRPEKLGYRYVALAHPIINQHMEPFWVAIRAP